MAAVRSQNRQDELKVAVEVVEKRYDELCETVALFSGDVLRIDASAVQPSTVLLDLGAQSSDIVELVFRLNETYGIDLPREFLVPYAFSVDTLVMGVVKELAKRRRDSVAPHG